WDGSIRYAVPILIEVTTEFLAGFSPFIQLFGAQPLAEIKRLLLQFERLRCPEVHSQVEVHGHENRRLESIGEIETPPRKIEARIHIMGNQQDMPGVAMGSPIHQR